MRHAKESFHAQTTLRPTLGLIQVKQVRTPFLTSQKPFDLLVSYELFPLEHVSKVCRVFSVVVLRREAVYVPLAQLSEEVCSLR